MFDIGLGELLLVFIIGLVVLGPERLPSAVKSVVGWIRTIRGLASTVQRELAEELRLQELQQNLKKNDTLELKNLSPELKASVEQLKEATQTIHNPNILMPEQPITAASHDDQTLHNQEIDGQMTRSDKLSQELQPESTMVHIDNQHDNPKLDTDIVKQSASER